MPMEVARSRSASATRPRGGEHSSTPADQAQPVRRHSRSQAQRGGGWARSRSPGVQAVRAAPPGAKASAMKARRGRDAAGGSLRSTPAQARHRRETHRSVSQEISFGDCTQTRKHDCTRARVCAEQRNRRADSTTMHRVANASRRQAADALTRRSAFSPLRRGGLTTLRRYAFLPFRIGADSAKPRRMDSTAATRMDHTAPRRGGAPRATQSPLLRVQISVCAPSSPSTRRA